MDQLSILYTIILIAIGFFIYDNFTNKNIVVDKTLIDTIPIYVYNDIPYYNTSYHIPHYVSTYPRNVYNHMYHNNKPHHSYNKHEHKRHK